MKTIVTIRTRTYENINEYIILVHNNIVHTRMYNNTHTDSPDRGNNKVITLKQYRHGSTRSLNTDSMAAHTHIHIQNANERAPYNPGESI
jgi:hypothetical protein